VPASAFPFLLDSREDAPFSETEGQLVAKQNARAGSVWKEDSWKLLFELFGHCLVNVVNLRLVSGLPTALRHVPFASNSDSACMKLRANLRDKALDTPAFTSAGDSASDGGILSKTSSGFAGERS